MTTLLFCAAMALVLGGCGAQAGAGKGSGEATETANARFAPQRTDIRGESLKPFDDPDCKAVALVFFMPDCPIANSYVPELNRLHGLYGPGSIAIYVVQADPQITLEQAAKHQQEYALVPPVVLDPEHEWVKLAGATRTPEAAVFSREGKLLYRGRIDDRYVAVGKQRPGATKHDLADALEAIALGRSVPQATTEAVGCYIPELAKEK